LLYDTDIEWCCCREQWNIVYCCYRTQWTAPGSVFGAVTLWFFLFVCEISREPLNGFAPTSHGTLVWCLARTSLKVKIKGQRSRSPGTRKQHFSALSAACVRFIFG